MKRNHPKPATKSERAYVRELEHTSSFELVDQRRGRILALHEYPEPLKRFLKRERTMGHMNSD